MLLTLCIEAGLYRAIKLEYIEYFQTENARGSSFIITHQRAETLDETSLLFKNNI